MNGMQTLSHYGVHSKNRQCALVIRDGSRLYCCKRSHFDQPPPLRAFASGHFGGRNKGRGGLRPLLPLWLHLRKMRAGFGCNRKSSGKIMLLATKQTTFAIVLCGRGDKLVCGMYEKMFRAFLLCVKFISILFMVWIDLLFYYSAVRLSKRQGQHGPRLTRCRSRLQSWGGHCGCTHWCRRWGSLGPGRFSGLASS